MSSKLPMLYLYSREITLRMILFMLVQFFSLIIYAYIPMLLTFQENVPLNCPSKIKYHHTE